MYVINIFIFFIHPGGEVVYAYRIVITIMYSLYMQWLVDHQPHKYTHRLAKWTFDLSPLRTYLPHGDPAM